MTAPRVVLLTYHIELPSGWTVPDAADAWSATLGDFDVELKGVELEARSRGDYYSVESAQAAIDPHLKVLEAHEDLKRNVKLSSRLTGAQLEPSETTTGKMHPVVLMATVDVSARLSVVAEYRPDWPTPTFTETDQVRLLRKRWRDARESRSPLLAESEFVLTSLRQRFGQDTVHTALNVSVSVLEHGRKVKTTAPPLTDAEVAWLNVVVPALIYRLGEVEGGATRPNLLRAREALSL